MKIFVTGAAGFIGFSLSLELLKKKHTVYAIDNLDDYYSLKLKKKRLKILKKYKKFKFKKIDISKKNQIYNYLKKKEFDVIFHFAAQAGVRYSIINPKKYIQTNIKGFQNVLKILEKKKFKVMFYASSSSVYGDTKKFPLKENNKLSPNNTYSLTKKFNEDISKVFNKYYGLKLIGLRFFTVYGEWGRPDMFISKLILSNLKKKKFSLNNFGNHFRDFTYIGDVVEILYRLMKKKIKSSNDIFNICSNKPLNLHYVIKKLEKHLGKVKIVQRKLQQADVIKTHGSNKKINMATSFKNYKKFEEGLKKTIEWSKEYYK